MKKQISALLALSLCASLLMGCSETETETVEEVSVKPTSVETHTVSSSDIANSVKLSGKISAKNEVSVFSLMTSEVLNIGVEVGDRVTKDQFLFYVEEYPTDDFNREINNLLTTYDSTKEILDEATYQIQKALDDTRALYEVGAASLYEVEQLEFSLFQQENTNQTQLDTITNALQQLYDQREDLNENAVVLSPIDGIVTQVNIIEHMYASNAYAAVVIADDSVTQIQLSVSETVVPYTSIGDTVLVSIPSANIPSFEAVISNVSPSTNVQTGMYTVVIDLPQDTEYYLGMFAEVLITTNQAIDTLNIPSSSIIIDDDANYVFVVSSDNTVSKVYVSTGITNGTYTQITDGLSGGEELVITGQEYLSDGSLVSITGGK